MTATALNLNPAQLSIMKTYAKTHLSDTDLKELNQMLLDFFYQKAMKMVKKADEDLGYTSETFKEWSEEHNRIKTDLK
jgi:hypothetical protein